MPLTSIVTALPSASRSRPRSDPTPHAARAVEQAAVAEVNAFVDWLAALPLSAWLEVGRAISGNREQIAARGLAWEFLQDAIAEHDLQVAAWFVRDAVETAAFLASHSVRRWSPGERRVFAAAHGGAEAAALSLLGRSFLHAAHLTSLYGMFGDRRAAPTSLAQGTEAVVRTG